jgi:amino acid adenylation domain-containing protein
MVSILNYIYDSYKNFPKNTAIQQQESQLTYQEVWEQSVQISEVIKFSERPWVAVKVNKCVEVLPAFLGCWIAGKGYVPIHPSYPSERVQMILDDCQSDIFIDPQNQTIVHQEKLIHWKNLKPFHETKLTFSSDLNNPAYLLFTSGSTGKPKGVPIFHKQLATFIEAMFQHQPLILNATDRFLQMFEFTFDLSVFSTFFPLCLGASTHLLPNEGIAAFNIVNVLEEQNITVALMVPSVLNYLKPYFDEIHLPFLRYNLFCGEPLKWSLLKEWKNCLPNAYIENVYGPTEATIFCSYYPISENTEQECYNDIVPIGKPLPFTNLYLLDNELVISGGQVTSGYWNQPLKTAEVFFQKDNINHYKTGDICKINENQDFIYIERKDFQVKIDGYRIELSEIEKVGYEFMQELCAAVAVQNSQGSYSLYFFVKKGTNLSELKNHFQNFLPPYMLPKQLIEIDEFPINLSGKLDRKQLMEIAKLYV